ncbi:MAG: serine hydrolase [Actinomycetota bacterium]
MSPWRLILPAALAGLLSFPGLAHAAGSVIDSPSSTATPSVIPSPVADGTVSIHVSLVGHGSVSSTPPGIDCPPICTGTFAPGTVLRLLAKADSSWKLKGWGGLCGGKRATCDVLIPASDRPLPIRARFLLVQRSFAFWSEVLSYINTRSDRVGVAVFDRKSLHLLISDADSQFDTASTVKAQILGTLLVRAEREHRELSEWEMSNAIPMIEQSDNNAATNLWDSVGGADGVHRFDESIGMNETDPNPGAWGLTRVTARDSVTLMRNFVYVSKHLSTHYRDVALSLFEDVEPSQRWGISGGVHGAHIAIKNGWLPHGFGWIINSIGGVWGTGRDYIIAVLTDGNPSEDYGIETIEGISRIVWSGLRP